MSTTQAPSVLIGGFLGAGKTAAMLALADWLANQGIRAGFITNDQGSDLVDTRLLRSCGCRDGRDRRRLLLLPVRRPG